MIRTWTRPWGDLCIRIEALIATRYRCQDS
jgi:hypothetical protein